MTTLLFICFGETMLLTGDTLGGALGGLLTGVTLAQLAACCGPLNRFRARFVERFGRGAPQPDWQTLLAQVPILVSDWTTVWPPLTERVRQLLGCDRVAVYQFQGSWHGSVVAESVAQAVPPWLGEQSPAIQRLGVWHKGQLLDAAEAKIYWVNNVATEPANCQPLTEVLPTAAYATVPLFSGSQLWGLLLCYEHRQPRTWSASVRTCLEQLGQRLSQTLQQNCLLQQQQQHIQTLQSDRDAATTANQSKSEFLAYMSHELRTPLNAILGFTQVLQRDADQMPLDQRQSVDIIARSGEHLLRLVNDILDMSKIEAGQMALNEQNFDLHQLLKTLEDMLRLRAETKGISLAFVYETDTPQYIYSDEQKLRQILLNLLGNAINFTEAGSVTCRVWAESLTSDTACPEDNPIQLFVAVEDTGSGIHSDEIDTLFEAFHQARQPGAQQEGTGLGLAISHRFVEIMRGKLGVISELGKGSTFTVRIPCRWVQDQPQTVAIAVPAVPQRTYKMLVTDDDATSRLLLTKLFGSMGHDIRQAQNGQEAVEIWRQWQPDLVWMDIRMPIMDGCEATQQIKAADTQGKTVVIALTASAFEEQRQMMLASGCTDFVRKPFRRDELLGKIRQHLEPDVLESDLAPKPAAEPATETVRLSSLRPALPQVG